MQIIEKATDQLKEEQIGQCYQQSVGKNGKIRKMGKFEKQVVESVGVKFVYRNKVKAILVCIL